MNRIVTILVAGFVALMLLSSTIFVVDQRKFAIVFALGQVKEVINKPGLHFKLPPPFENVLYLDKRIMTIEPPNAERFITAEKMNVLVDAFVKWRIANPKLYYVSFGGDESRAGDRMSQIVKAALNDEITKRTVREVISGEQINNSVYDRMKAERVRVANELRSTGSADSEKIRADADKQRVVILAEAYRDAESIRGEGDAKASQIYADAFGKNPEFYKFYRSLEAYRATFKNHGDVMVVDSSSDFFKYFKGSGAAGAPAAAAKK